jgi:Tfp pilus assembly protein PilX
MLNESGIDPMTPAPDGDNQRKGIALITALFGVVVLGVLMSGMYFTSNQEYKGTRNALVEQRGFAIAEYGLNSEISNWDRARNKPSVFPIGKIDSTKVYPAAGDTAWVKVTRLTDNTFWVVSEGQANIGVAQLEARRLTGAFVRIAYPTINPKGAITAAGNVNLQGSATVDGDDQHPAGWTNCGALSPTVPAVTVPPGATVNSTPANFASTPAIGYDSAAADSNTYVRYGSESWNTLTANADITLPGGVYGANIFPVGTATTCDKSVKFNWGEPYRPGTVAGCYNYFPIIYTQGSVHLDGDGYGQGILLVNGDLEINGMFEFYGIIIVRDDVLKGNGTAKIHGAVFAGNLTLSDPLSWMTGNNDIFYSRCAVENALSGSAILVRVTQRHWAQIF